MANEALALPKIRPHNKINYKICGQTKEVKVGK